MPVLTAAKIAFMGAAKAIIGTTSSNPIESDADMLEWKNAQSGGRIGGPVWIKESSINSGNAYEVYCEYKNSKCQALAAVFASGDSNTSPDGGKERWLTVKNPATSGDWGTATHTFNDNFDFYGYSANDKSARTRIWFELGKNKTYLKFINHAQNDDLFYTMINSKVWGTRMKGSGDGGDGTNDYFDNGGSIGIKGSATIITAVDADGGGTPNFQSSKWKNLGLGVTDAELSSANSNDVVMIFANSTGNVASGTGDWGAADAWTGIGAKRSQASGNFAHSYTWNGTGGDSIAGNILDDSNHNGNIAFDTNAAILMFVPPF